MGDRRPRSGTNADEGHRLNQRQYTKTSSSSTAAIDDEDLDEFTGTSMTTRPPLSKWRCLYFLLIALLLTVLLLVVLAIIFQFFYASQTLHMDLFDAGTLIVPIPVSSVWLDHIVVSTPGCVSAFDDNCQPISAAGVNITTSQCYQSAVVGFRNQWVADLELPVGQQLWTEFSYEWACEGTACVLNRTLFPTHNTSTLILSARLDSANIDAPPLWIHNVSVNAYSGHWSIPVNLPLKNVRDAVWLTVQFLAHPGSDGFGYGVANLTLLSYQIEPCTAAEAGLMDREYGIPRNTPLGALNLCLHVDPMQTQPAPSATQCTTSHLEVQMKPRLWLLIPLLLGFVALFMLVFLRCVLVRCGGHWRSGFSAVSPDDLDDHAAHSSLSPHIYGSTPTH